MSLARLREPRPTDDARLAAALKGGGVDARVALFDRHGEHVRRVLVRLLGAHDPDRADLLHTVFVRAYEGAVRLQSAEALKAWLTRIAVFTVREHLRRKRRRRWLTFTDEPPELPAATATEGDREAAACVYRILDAMPVDERLPFVLHTLDGMNLDEVAPACGLSYATTRRRLARARRRFLKLARQYEALEGWIGHE